MIPPIFKPYTEAQYARREVWCSVLMLVGMAWLATLAVSGWRMGLMTALAAVFAGAAFGCYRTRKTERGVWMLALLVGGGVVVFLAFAAVMRVLDMRAGRGGDPLWLAVDVAGATVLATITARASWTVVVQNRALPPPS